MSDSHLSHEEETVLAETNPCRAEESDTFLKGEDSASGPKGDTLDAEAADYRKLRLTKRLLVDHPFRRRFIHSVSLCWTVVGMGWVAGQMGPSFPDLRNLVGQSVDTAAWIFTIFSLGFAVGSLIEGVLYKRLNTLLTLTLLIVIMAVTSAVLPWCPSLIAMVVVRFVSGLAGGAVEAIANSDVAAIWDEEGRPYMQALHFSYGLGGVLSPLATEPFLSPKTCVPTSIIENGSNTLGSSSSEGTTVLTALAHNSTTATCQWVYGETKVHYAFLSTFFIVLSGAVPFFITFISHKRTQKSPPMKADKRNMKRPEALPLLLKVTLLVLLCSILFMYCAVEDTFSSFLMTFCIQYLGWTKEQGSYASSLHWLAFAVGRFSGIFLVRWVTPENLIFAFTSLLVASFVGLLLASLTMTSVAIWLLVPLTGFSMSVICPSIYSWTEEAILELTVFKAALFVLSCAGGLVINPLVLGYLIETFDPIAFPYLLLAQSIVCLVLYLITRCLVKGCVTPMKRRELELEIK